MNKQVFLIDVDGIIGDFDSRFLKSFRDVTGIKLKNSVITKYDVMSCLPRDKKIEKAVFEHTNKSGWCSEIKPYKGAVKAVKKLMKMFDVYIVTASSFYNPTWTHEREMWLREHFGKDVKTIHTKHKHMVKGDYFLDDKTENVEAWAESNQEGTAIIWNKLYNQECPYYRIDSWNELFKLIKEGSQYVER